MHDDPRHDHTGPPAWLEHVRRRAAGWAASGIGPGWVVAVSGGGDSVGLLRTLHGLREGLGLRLSVAHLDHGTRGEAGREDGRFVAALAEGLGLPIDLGSWTPARKGHFEADARTARYTWLAEVARARGASAVAVGHTRDDLAETILQRIVRGTGLRGLAGIPARRPLAAGVALVRPLLGVSRREIRDELARLGQSFREDPTNGDVARTRARIRHDLIPRLEADYNPQVVAAIVRLGRHAAADRRLLDAVVGSLSASVVREAGPDRIVFDARAAAGLDQLLAAEVVRRAWRAADWPERAMTASRWGRIARGLVRGSREDHLGAGASLHVEGDGLVLERGARSEIAVPEIASTVLDGPGSAAVPWAAARIEAEILDESPAGFDEVVDLDRVRFPLVVRTPRPGDRWDPLGMAGRRQRLVEFLRLRGVPRERRASVPVVADRSGVIWVVGHRIAERVRTSEATSRRLGLRWRTAPSEVDGPDGLP
ncbi:tRNA lysidine(34) synthetase TilS [Paludisphaera mucosa]|uniref:tRNA(Ile)-lysidine synthase n=1 Tax=Paludisphaera mucosa TaxID=3030827 RepID=A0ABT6FF68_9BACT|nr:tRNA lysidine(34) synthetase TilS [Paludisphaera mucosa]MDG3006043.1 tRNA lysidine(34) synthetase TilS [Paludisphaera mucosa]